MRGKAAKQRKVQPDLLYGSEVVTKLINKTMLHGKKTVAEKLVYSAMEELGKQTKENPAEALEKALNNIKPVVEVRSRRVGGANYQVPVPVPESRQQTLAIRWLLEGVRGRKGGNFDKFLAEELLNAYKGTGTAMKKKEEVVRMAEASKAFSHFAW